MKSKIASKRKLIIIATGVLISLTIILFFSHGLQILGSYMKRAPSAINQISRLSKVGLPVRFKIPKINIDAAVEYVGLTSDGAMAVPKGPDSVAWFNIGPRPGEKGSAVIAGHEGWKNDIPAVFDNLHALQKGDKIYVEDEKGTTTAFVVRELKTYGEKDDAADVFYSNDGKAHLNLVTCEGIWNKAKKSYSNRLVVFADKMTEL